MKVLKVMMAAALLLAAKQASALIDISGFGGYTTLNMSGVNTALDHFAANNSGTSTDVKSGYYVGADAGITTFPFLKIGPRLEYVGAGQGVVTTPGGKATVDSNLLLLEAGVTFDTSLPLTGLSVIGGVWGGYGMANATVTQTGSGDFTGKGGAFCGEVAAQLRYKLVAGLSIGLDLGYRLANIATVNDTNGNPLIADPNSGDAEPFDFSGFNVGGAVSFDF